MTTEAVTATVVEVEAEVEVVLVVFKKVDILFKRRELLERDTTVRERLLCTVVVLDGESRPLSHGEREPLSLRPGNHPLLLQHTGKNTLSL
jgi:hypothetical protein